MKDRLRQKQAAIAARWLDKALHTYPPETAEFFATRENQFANPVGQTFSTATRAIVEILIDGMDAQAACAQLEEIIRIRAIQEFTPSQAVSFVFMLKDALREELEGELQDAGAWAELGRIDADIDQLALFAFDIYAKCRERVYQLRVHEVRRGFDAPGQGADSAVRRP